MAENFSQLAKDFIDRANGGSGLTGTWRLEVLQKRLSSNADGTPKDREIPVRIRRFLKGIPWAQVHDAIRYLISKSPYKGIIYNGIELDGKYRPTLTQWRRDDQEQVGGNAQGSYTLIQDLIEVTDDGDKLDTVSADSCSETEETTWVWDAPEIEELPDNKGKQGETYAIRQVRRNEDGTFDYAIVRQVAKTKISGWKVTECDKYSRVSVKVFDNVYGGLFDGDPFTDGTTVLQIPAPCKTDNGTLVQVSVAQNPDCTFRVTVQETVAKQNVEKTSETRKGLRGVVTSETTVATNPLPETGLELGEQVRNELRPDGLYDVTHVTVAKEPVGDIGSSCETTVFEHRHVESENVPDRPEKEASSAGGGKTYQVQSRVTEEGTWDVSRTVTEEKPVATAQHIMRKTLRGVTETTVSRNVSDSAVSVSEIGDEVRVEKTPGGLWNRTETHASHEPVGVIGKSCSSTPVVHTDTTVSNVPNGSQPEPQHQSPEVNVEKTVETRRTEEGTWDVTERITVYQPDVISGLKAGSEAAEVELEIGKNVVEKPSSETGKVNVETSISASKNDHGSYDYQKRTTTYHPRGPKMLSTSSTPVSEVESYEFRSLPEVPDMPHGDGIIVYPSVTMNNIGSFDGGYVVKTAKPKDSGWITWAATVKAPTHTLKYEHGLRVFKNLDSPPKPDEDTSCSVDCNINEYGLYDGKMTYSKLLSWDIGSGNGPSQHTFETYREVYGTWKRVEVTTYIGQQPSASMIGDGYVVGIPGGCQVIKPITR